MRVVEYNTFERVGSAERIDVDVRIVAATNADLWELVRRERFKADLLDRLSFEVLVVPPLRARRGDVQAASGATLCRTHGPGTGPCRTPRDQRRKAEALERHTWPGNVRELKNVVERAVYRSDAAVISEIEFDPFQSPYAAPITADCAKRRSVLPRHVFRTGRQGGPCKRLSGASKSA